MTLSIQARVHAQIEKAPDRPALAFVDPQGRFAWQSREQVYRRAAHCWRRLAERGCRRGDVCLLVLPSDEFCATVLLGALLGGAVPLLVAPPILQGGRHSSLKDIVKSILKRTRVRLVIAHETLERDRSELEGISAETTFVFGEQAFGAAATGSDDPPLPVVSQAERDTAALQLTSGTTGVPRICRWQQGQVLAALDGMALAMGLEADDICLNWTPLYHDMGLANNFLLCLTHGVPLVMLSPTDFVKQPARWLRALHDTGATITWSPNFGYAITAQRVKDAEIEGIRLDRVRTFWNAAEKIHLDTVLGFLDRFAPYGVRRETLKMNFGCVENVGGATFTDLNTPFAYERVDARALQEERIARPLPDGSGGNPVVIVGAGRPHPHLRISIAGEDGSPLPDGHVGEVLLDTPSRMTEYVGQPEETREALRGDLVRTGDLGYLRDGELFWVGRVRERIVVRGRKIDPSEFEGILLKIPELRAGCFAAFGVEDRAQGTERIVLAAEVNESDPTSYSSIAETIHEQVNLELGVGVSDIVLVERGMLAKTSSGKRRHRHFRDLYLQGGLESVYRSRAR